MYTYTRAGGALLLLMLAERRITGATCTGSSMPDASAPDGERTMLAPKTAPATAAGLPGIAATAVAALPSAAGPEEGSGVTLF